MPGLIRHPEISKMNILRKYGQLGMLMLIATSFIWALFFVNWSLRDLFLTPDQQGSRLMAKKEYKKAAEVFQEPMQRGTALYRDGDFKEAAAAFGQDDSAAAIYNRANALVMLGKYDDAIAGYDKAVSMKPDWKEARDNLNLAKIRKKKMKPPDDDAGGTGGKLGADEIVFDNRASKAPENQTETVEGGEQLSDQELRSLWLRRVQTKPADFLRAKFSYQSAMGQQGK